MIKKQLYSCFFIVQILLSSIIGLHCCYGSISGEPSVAVGTSPVVTESGTISSFFILLYLVLYFGTTFGENS